MGLVNILSSISVTSFGEGFGAATISYKWIYDFISWLVSFGGDLGLGIILFTLALKLVTLPLDIISRASMKKNSLKMELMKDDLEKLQKQYANNKELYQQKMMALYKKNGYSAFSACLPTIITLVFFFIVLAGFQSFSRYENKQVFNEMGKAYSVKVEEIANSGALVKKDEKTYELNINAALKAKGVEGLFDGYGEAANTDTDNYTLNVSSVMGDNDKIVALGLQSYFVNGDYNYDNTDLRSNINLDAHDYLVKAAFLSDAALENSLKERGIISLSGEKYVINDFNSFYEAVKTYENVAKYLVNTSTGEEVSYAINFKALLGDNAELKADFEKKAEDTVTKAAIETVSEEFIKDYVKTPARHAAKDAYYEYRSHSVITPWINNLWAVDSPFSKAIPTYSEFKTQMQSKAENIGSLEEADYNEITYELEDLKQTGFGKGNGYFILVAISILAMLGSTLVTQKMQKTQMQLSTVDGANGQTATTQKMMTWMMPAMFGIFAFMYSAAFSMYMITSTLLSTGSTMLINFFVEKSFKKKLENEEADKANQRRYGKRR